MTKLALHGGSPAISSPIPTWPIYDQREEEALLGALRSGQWGRLGGTATANAEEAFAQFNGSRHAIALNSGQTALRLALLALDLEPGDEVIVPPYTFIASAAAIVEANLTPVFADIEPDSLCLDPTALDRVRTKRTRVLMPVHLGGQPAAMDPLLEYAARHGLAVVEDASHAHGSEYNGLRAGAIGEIGCFSLQASKNLNCGEGGLLVTDDPGLAETVAALMNNGRFPGGSRYEHATLGGNYRMTEFQAAVLGVQLERLEEQTALRDSNALELNRRIGKLPGFRPQSRTPGTERNATHLWCFQMDVQRFGAGRDRILEALRAEGVPCGPGYATLVYEHPMFTEKRFGAYGASALGYVADPAHHRALCPVSHRVAKETGAWLPQVAMLGDNDYIRQIGDAFEKVWSNRSELPA